MIGSASGLGQCPFTFWNYDTSSGTSKTMVSLSGCFGSFSTMCTPFQMSSQELSKPFVLEVAFHPDRHDAVMPLVLGDC